MTTIDKAELDKLEGLYAAALLDENDDYAGKEPDRIEFLFALCKAWPRLIAAARSLPAERRAREEAVYAAAERLGLLRAAEADIAQREGECQRQAARATTAETEAASLRERVKALEEAVRTAQGYGCPVCSGDCGSANPPVICCPMQEYRDALALRARATLEEKNDG